MFEQIDGAIKTKRKKGWRRNKPGTESMGEREAVRKDVRKADLKQVLENLDYLGDPFDQMDLETKKQHALSMYYHLIKVNFENNT